MGNYFSQKTYCSSQTCDHFVKIQSQILEKLQPNHPDLTIDDIIVDSISDGWWWSDTYIRIRVPKIKNKTTEELH